LPRAISRIPSSDLCGCVLGDSPWTGNNTHLLAERLRSVLDGFVTPQKPRDYTATLHPRCAGEYASRRTGVPRRIPVVSFLSASFKLFFDEMRVELRPFNRRAPFGGNLSAIRLKMVATIRPGVRRSYWRWCDDLRILPRHTLSVGSRSLQSSRARVHLQFRMVPKTDGLNTESLGLPSWHHIAN
jgi:hypothetical protein